MLASNLKPYDEIKISVKVIIDTDDKLFTKSHQTELSSLLKELYILKNWDLLSNARIVQHMKID